MTRMKRVMTDGYVEKITVIASEAKQSRAATTEQAALDCFVAPAVLLAMTFFF